MVVSKSLITWLLLLTLGSMLLVGLFPAFNTASDQVEQVSIMHQMDRLEAGMPVEHNMPMHCCDADGLPQCNLVICGFVVPQSVSVIHFVGTHQVAFSPFIIQLNYLKLTAPPPKI